MSWNSWTMSCTIYVIVFIFLRSWNPFPHIDAFWRICSRRLFENIVSKEEIAQNKQFLLFFDKICSKSSTAELSYEGKGYLTNTEFFKKHFLDGLNPHNDILFISQSTDRVYFGTPVGCAAIGFKSCPPSNPNNPFHFFTKLGYNIYLENILAKFQFQSFPLKLWFLD